MIHREAETFSIHLHLSAEFPEDYEGDLDGLAWHREFDDELRERLVSRVLDTLRESRKLRAVLAPRGSDPSRRVDVDVTRIVR